MSEIGSLLNCSGSTRRIQLAALLGGAGERLEACAERVEPGADGGVQLRVALLLADEVREYPGALDDRAELEVLVAVDDLGERLARPAQPALRQRLVDTRGRSRRRSSSARAMIASISSSLPVK